MTQLLIGLVALVLLLLLMPLFYGLVRRWQLDPIDVVAWAIALALTPVLVYANFYAIPLERRIGGHARK